MKNIELLNDSLQDLYDTMELESSRKFFNNKEQDIHNLSESERFCLAIIHMIDEPAINELAEFIHVSQPNCAYKVNSLVKKGYVRKVQSSKDRREIHLELTPKYEQFLQDNCVCHFMAEEIYSHIEREKLEVFLEVLADIQEIIDEKKKNHTL